jgi:hypothetical protein
MEGDITASVLTSLWLDSHSTDLSTPWPTRASWPFRMFAGIEQTRNNTGFESERPRYRSAQLQSATRPEPDCTKSPYKLAPRRVSTAVTPW